MKATSSPALESDFFPGLTARDGSYTKKEFRAFQREAAAQGVEILPEIDVPAHSLAFTHYRPSLGSEEFGADHLNLRNPAVIPFLDSLFTEYCAGPDPVFVGSRVHIGTDEYSNKDKAVVELFRSLTDHLIRHVERYGKQAVAWGALTHADGQTPVKSKNVILEAWYNGYADPAKMKAQGYQLISIPDGYVYIVPAAGYYYDYLNCPMLYEKWTPAQIGNQKFEEGDPAILGGMFAVWNDHAGNGITVRDIHHRVMPALRTISAKTWTGASAVCPALPKGVPPCAVRAPCCCPMPPSIGWAMPWGMITPSASICKPTPCAAAMSSSPRPMPPCISLRPRTANSPLSAKAISTSSTTSCPPVAKCASPLWVPTAKRSSLSTVVSVKPSIP